MVPCRTPHPKVSIPSGSHPTTPGREPQSEPVPLQTKCGQRREGSRIHQHTCNTCSLTSKPAVLGASRAYHCTHSRLGPVYIRTVPAAPTQNISGGLGLVTRVGEMHYRAPQDTFYIRPLLSRTREGDDLPNTDTQRVTQTEETGI